MTDDDCFYLMPRDHPAHVILLLENKIIMSWQCDGHLKTRGTVICLF